MLGCGTGQGRHQLEVSADGCGLETHDLVLLGEIAVGAALAWEETDVVALDPRVGADRIDPPDLRPVDVLEPELVEGNSDLHLEAVVDETTRRFPDRVPRDVVPVVDVVVDGVGLNPERVGEEFVSPAFVVEGVEDDSHPVVLPGVIAVAKTGANPFGLGVESPKCHQHPVFVVGDEHDGPHRRLDVLTRLHLVLELEGEGIVPCRFVDRPVDDDLRRRARYLVAVVPATALGGSGGS